MKIFEGLLKYFLPIVIVIVLFIYNALVGVGAVLLYIAYLIFVKRASVFAFIGSMRYSKGKLEEAVRWFERSYATGNAKPRWEVSYGYLLLKSGNVEMAEKILNAVVNSNYAKADKLLAKSNLALAIWKNGNLDGAIALLEEVTEELKTTTIYGSLGYLLVIKGDLDKALKYNEEAYDYNNTNGIIMDNLGQTYFLLGEYDKAEEIFNKLLAANPTFPEAYYNYALLMEVKDQKEKALEYMKKALRFTFSFLSTVTKEEVQAKIEELEQK